MKSRYWKSSKKYGSFFKTEDNLTISTVPMLANGQMSKGQPHTMSLEGFPSDKREDFIQEMVALFGEEIKNYEPLKSFGK